MFSGDTCKDAVDAIWVACSFDLVHRLDDGVDVGELDGLGKSWLVDGLVYFGGFWDFELYIWVVLLEAVSSD